MSQRSENGTKVFSVPGKIPGSIPGKRAFFGGLFPGCFLDGKIPGSIPGKMPRFQSATVVGCTGLKPQGVESSYENEKQASLPRLNARAQNDLVLAILLRYVSF